MFDLFLNFLYFCITRFILWKHITNECRADKVFKKGSCYQRSINYSPNVHRHSTNLSSSRSDSRFVSASCTTFPPDTIHASTPEVFLFMPTLGRPTWGSYVGVKRGYSRLVWTNNWNSDIIMLEMFSQERKKMLEMLSIIAYRLL